MLLFWALITMVGVCGDAAHWAVIAVGSNGWANYRHHADACHAYQVLKSNGFNEDHIVMMAYDDVAHDPQNPFKGKLFNQPDPHGAGTDVYAGCKIDYRGADVTPENFLGVLAGDAPGKVLQSTSEDNVFVYFADHGGPGLICFPSSELHKIQLQQAFSDMHLRGRFKKLVFYLEACDSGSMLEGLNISGLYAVSATGAGQVSYAAYCGADSKVNGTELGTCLADLFSSAWLKNSDQVDITKETLAAQWNAVEKGADIPTRSEPGQYSDLTFTSESVSDFLGSEDVKSILPTAVQRTVGSAWAAQAKVSTSNRYVDLDRLQRAYTAATTSSKRIAAMEDMQLELRRQLAAEYAYRHLVELACPGDDMMQRATQQALEPPHNPACEVSAHAAFRVHCAAQFDANSGFALPLHQVVVNLCADVTRGSLRANITALVQQVCNVGQIVV